MTRTNVAKELGIPRLGSRRGVRVGAAASALTVMLICGVASPAVAQPNESRKVHVEGQLIPVEKSPGIYRVSGGLLGTYRLRTERVINAWTYWDIQIREIEGTEAITGCGDLNLNGSCDAGEPSADLRLTFSRVASFDTGTGRLIESRSTHQLISNGSFSGGQLATRDIPVGSSDELCRLTRATCRLWTPVWIRSKQISLMNDRAISGKADKEPRLKVESILMCSWL